MVAKLRVLAALCALVAAVIVVWQANPAGPQQVRAIAIIPMTNVTTSIKWPVIDIDRPRPVQPVPRHPARRGGSPRAWRSRRRLPRSGLRCKYDAGNYQMAVEAFVWRTYEESLPADAVELDIDGHRAAQYWIMKPTDWNNRWWITCVIAFETSYGVIQQTLFYSPIYSEPDPDCMQTNLQRAHELVPVLQV